MPVQLMDVGDGTLRKFFKFKHWLFGGQTFIVVVSTLKVVSE
jgi:hypothetical protein